MKPCCNSTAKSAMCSRSFGTTRHHGGLDLTRAYPELGNSLLVCATEVRTDEDIERYATALAEVMK